MSDTKIHLDGPTDAPLLIDTAKPWLDCVLDNFDEFLIDHGANEKKASAAAMSLISHYPDRSQLVMAMADLALEELNHFRQVLRLMLKRNLHPGNDEKDPYINRIIKSIRKGKGSDAYFIDRLLTSAIIEARGAERFSLIATNIKDGELATFYTTLARSEQNHYELFIDLAKVYFPAKMISERWQEWRHIEAEILQSLTIRPRLH